MGSAGQGRRLRPRPTLNTNVFAIPTLVEVCAGCRADLAGVSGAGVGEWLLRQSAGLLRGDGVGPLHVVRAACGRATRRYRGAADARASVGISAGPGVRLVQCERHLASADPRRSFHLWFIFTIFKGKSMKANLIKLFSAVTLIGGSTAVWAAGACCVAGAICCGAMPCCL